MNKIIVILILGILVLIVACSDDVIDNGVPAASFTELNLPDQAFNYANIQLPNDYTTNEFPSQFQFQAITEFDNTPIDNPITDAGATSIILPIEYPYKY